MILLLGELTL